MSDELKACPFCGQKSLTYFGGDPMEPWDSLSRDAWIECNDGDGVGCGADISKPTWAEAIAAWNRRSP